MMMATLPECLGLRRVVAVHESEHEPLRDGDIVFRGASTILSFLARQFSPRDRTFSHCGILAIEDGKPLVIHAASPDERRFSGRVFADGLTRFMGNSFVWGAFRLKGSWPQQKRVADFAREKLRQNAPFDHAFSLDHDHGFYCSKLVWRAVYVASGIDVVPQKQSWWGHPYISIDDLSLNTHLVRIAGTRVPPITGV